MNAAVTRLTRAARAPWVRKVVKAIVFAAVFTSIACALARYRHPLEGRLEQVHVRWLALGIGLSVLYRVLNAYGWILVVRSLGRRMRPCAGVRLWLVTETLRWLPGGVWGMFSRAARAKTAGVPPMVASLSVPLELLLSIAAWGITAAAGLGLSGGSHAWLSRLPTGWLAACAIALGLTIAAAFALAQWSPSTAISKKLHRLVGGLRLLKESRPRATWLAITVAFYTALCFLNGLAFLAVLRATCDSPPGLLTTAGINATGWLVGFFAFFAPTGLGVREGVLTAMLAPLMPVDAAIVGALLWRLIQIVVELVCLGACVAPAAASAVRRFAAATWAES
jgi:hypothetical protein